MKKTKIVCTLGPATDDDATIEQMLRNGMNVARLNFSHGTHEEHKQRIERFRRIRDRLELPAAILLDTRGPEVRICTFENDETFLEDGQLFTLTAREVPGSNEIVSVTSDVLSKCLNVGDKVLIDDGRIRTEVTEINGLDVICRVINGGRLTNRKGVNVPGVSLDLPYLSEKDKEDILFGIQQDVDFIAASFCRTEKDVIQLRNFLNYHSGHSIKIIAKIENLEGITNFDEILEQADGIMVARGDMGVEVPFEQLPGLQKRFIRSCYLSGKMVIVATQMLESMINNTNPTRAEISDVANAVFDGTSAVMLSGETTIGKYPARTVKVMAQIVLKAEHDALEQKTMIQGRYEKSDYVIDSSDITGAICDATCTTAHDLQAKAIIAATKTGKSARLIAKFRPVQPIVATTPETKTFHQLALAWGVYPVLSLEQESLDHLFQHAIDCARQFGFVEKGDLVVIAAGSPLAAGSTNMLKVQTLSN